MTPEEFGTVRESYARLETQYQNIQKTVDELSKSDRITFGVRIAANVIGALALASVPLLVGSVVEERKEMAEDVATIKAQVAANTAASARVESRVGAAEISISAGLSSMGRDVQVIREVLARTEATLEAQKSSRSRQARNRNAESGE